jgi:hypothetical protein
MLRIVAATGDGRGFATTSAAPAALIFTNGEPTFQLRDAEAGRAGLVDVRDAVGNPPLAASAPEVPFAASPMAYG